MRGKRIGGKSGWERGREAGCGRGSERERERKAYVGNTRGENSAVTGIAKAKFSVGRRERLPTWVPLKGALSIFGGSKPLANKLQHRSFHLCAIPAPAKSCDFRQPRVHAVADGRLKICELRLEHLYPLARFRLLIQFLSLISTRVSAEPAGADRDHGI
jgi:hypothetical protein